MRLNYFDYFRAIAIIIIVAGHSFSLWVIDTLPEKVLANIITGGTSLFVFISGFFFHQEVVPLIRTTCLGVIFPVNHAAINGMMVS